MADTQLYTSTTSNHTSTLCCTLRSRVCSYVHACVRALVQMNAIIQRCVSRCLVVLSSTAAAAEEGATMCQHSAMNETHEIVVFAFSVHVEYTCIHYYMCNTSTCDEGLLGMNKSRRLCVRFVRHECEMRNIIETHETHALYDTRADMFGGRWLI